MVSAEVVQPILNLLGKLCYVVLAVYISRVFLFIILGNRTGDSHRLREAMAMAYTLAAAVLIGYSVSAIAPFVTNIQEATNGLTVSAAGFGSYLSLCAGLVCAAFICNFSRSLWMLKSLDHAVFEPIPDWEDLSGSTLKRFLEFLPRAFAAVLFICLEFELKAMAGTIRAKDAALVASGTSPRNYLDEAGRYGLALYAALILWWIVGRYVITRKHNIKMPKSILFFYVAGLLNSLFIFLYGGANLTSGQAIGLLSTVNLATIAALYMLAIVVRDVAQTVWSFARMLFGIVRMLWGMLLQPRTA